MGAVGDFVGDLFGGGDDGSAAADASIRAAQIQAGAQREALDYLKKREEFPLEIREQALRGLSGLAGLTGGTGNQEQLIERAIQSPLYGQILGGREAGEEAILRSAAATGGLRSGNIQEALYDYNTQLENQALLQSYNQQLGLLQGLAGTPQVNPGLISQQISGIGQTQAQGIIAAEQARQAGGQSQFENLLGLGSLGVSSGLFDKLGGWIGSIFSDRRLKENVKLIGNVKGWNWYKWDWNVVAEKMGLKGECQGCMAEEVYAERPDAVMMKDLFLMVIYPKLGIFREGKTWH